MNEIDALKMMLRTGAKAHNVDPLKAVAAFERLTATTPPSKNKDLFISLCVTLRHAKTTEYTPARSNKLRMRLKRYSGDDLLRAAQAIANDEYMMGSTGRKYGTIDYLLRNDEQIDTWLQNADAVKQATKAGARLATPKIPPAVPEVSEEERQAKLARLAEMRAKFNERSAKPT